MESEDDLRKRYQELEVQEGAINQATEQTRAKIADIKAQMWELRGRLPPLVARLGQQQAPLLKITTEKTSILKRLKSSVRGAELTRKKK